MPTTRELRSLDRGQIHDREEWITKFVNTIVREMRLGWDRMTVVAAARDGWSLRESSDPRQAAKDWAGRAGPPSSG